MITYIDSGETIILDGMTIPKDGGNRHYAEFLELIAAGEAELVPPAGPTLAEAKASRILEATAACDAVLSPFGLEYGVWETATFDQQYSEALAYTASSTANVPLLAAMCVARGISIAELAGKIISNRAAWVSLTGYVIGQRQRIVTLIEAATTVEEVEAVDMTISLPG